MAVGWHDRVAGLSGLYHDLKVMSVPPECRDEYAALLAECERLMSDETALRRDETLDRLNGPGFRARVRGFVERIQKRDIKAVIEGLRRRPVV